MRRHTALLGVGLLLLLNEGSQPASSIRPITLRPSPSSIRSRSTRAFRA